MSSTTTISLGKLSRLIGTPGCPALIDVRTPEAYAADPRLLHTDDLAQLDAGMTIHDALYRWCRDATGETHDWLSRKPGA